MKNRQIFFGLIILLFGVLDLKAQILTDAVRYSNTNFGGTARTAAVGNSFGAMGGDFGVLSINPAGIADFRKSDLMFSFSFNNIENEAYLEADPSNIQTDDISNRMFLENVGAVFTYRPGSDWKTSNLAIGLNQIANLTEQVYFQGNTLGSYTERFVELGNGSSFANNIRDPSFLDDFEAGLAYETGAIFEHPDDDFEYVSDLIDSDIVPKSQSLSRSGRINEFSIAWAGNYQNKMGIGISMGIPFISFEEGKEYRETDLSNTIPVFESLVFNENLVTSGTGINFKLGLNTTLARVVRLGFAFHSPTWYSMEDNYSTSMRYSYNDGEPNTFEASSPDGRFEYNYTSPLKLIFSAGGLIRSGEKLRGFINADFEYKDYTSNSFGLGNDSAEREYERDLNQEINNELDAVFNIKLGAEIAYDKFRVRAGTNMIGSPYKDDPINDVDNLYSGGIGFRGDRFYIDVAYVTSNETEAYNPYQVTRESRNLVVNNSSNSNKFLFTFGFKI